MAAYLIVDVQVQDAVRYEDYKQMAAASVLEYGGKFLARGGKAEALEGARQPARVVVVEFPTYARAKEWWSSEAYRPAKALRQATAKTEMVLVEGT